MMRISLLALTLVAAACTGSLRPVPVNAGDTCFRCRRQIVETEYAAEVIDANMHAFKFRTPGCLAQYLDEHPQEIRAAFVTDYDTKKMVRADSASYVEIVMDERTRERDYAAFRQAASAERFATESGDEATLRWSDVLQARATAAGS